MRTLFDQPVESPPALVHNGTSTSRAAAESKARSGTADLDRNRIASYLHAWPDGATRHQIEAALSIPVCSVCPRVDELIKGGFVYEDGTRVWAGHKAAKVVRHSVHRGGNQ